VFHKTLKTCIWGVKKVFWVIFATNKYHLRYLLGVKIVSITLYIANFCITQVSFRRSFWKFPTSSPVCFHLTPPSRLKSLLAIIVCSTFTWNLNEYIGTSLLFIHIGKICTYQYFHNYAQTHQSFLCEFEETVPSIKHVKTMCEWNGQKVVRISKPNQQYRYLNFFIVFVRNCFKSSKD